MKRENGEAGCCFVSLPLLYAVDVVCPAQIELKTPVIEQQRRDYERALASHEQLTIRLDAAMRESIEKESQLALATGRLGEAEQQAELLKQEVVDLSTQLRVLLKEHIRLTRAAGIRDDTIEGDSNALLFPRKSLEEELKAASSLDPDDVISHNLVSFKDVAELQTRNVQLLRVVRQLSKERSEELTKSAAEAEAAASTGLQVPGAGSIVCCCDLPLMTASSAPISLPPRMLWESCRPCALRVRSRRRWC